MGVSENVSDFNFELVDINTDNFELEVQKRKRCIQC